MTRATQKATHGHRATADKKSFVFLVSRRKKSAPSLQRSDPEIKNVLLNAKKVTAPRTPGLEDDFEIVD
jgi:hypothetical protein